MTVSYFVRYEISTADLANFIEYYRAKHVPILARWPGALRVVLHTPADWNDPFAVSRGSCAAATCAERGEPCTALQLRRRLLPVRAHRLPVERHHDRGDEGGEHCEGREPRPRDRRRMRDETAHLTSASSRSASASHA